MTIPKNDNISGEAPILYIGNRQWAPAKPRFTPNELPKNTRKRKRGPRQKYLPFVEARAYAQTFGLQSSTDYIVWWDAVKPSQIPRRPDRKYLGSFQGWGDWLGIHNSFPQVGNWRTFKDAKMFVRNLKLTNEKQWIQAIKDNKIPHDIPKRPEKSYNGKFKGWADFLGVYRVTNPEFFKRYSVFYMAKNPDTPENSFIFGVHNSAPIDLVVDCNRKNIKLLRAYYMLNKFHWQYEVEKFCTPYQGTSEYQEWVTPNLFDFIDHLQTLPDDKMHYIQNIKK